MYDKMRLSIIGVGSVYMKCPNCKADMSDRDYCIRCGYMKNGKFIGQYNPVDKDADLKAYQDHYEEMLWNNKLYKPFFLGCFYFSWNRHLFVGLISGFIGLALYYLLMILFLSFPLLDNIPINDIQQASVFMFSVAAIIIIRTLYAAIANTICLYLDRKKILFMKKKYPEEYMQKLLKQKPRSFMQVLMHVMLYMLFFVIFLILARVF